jgi:hypothetical protein
MRATQKGVCYNFSINDLGGIMEKTQLQLEYLKEQYAQARQHETLRTNVTTFLTATAGVILGLIFKEGRLISELWWGGIVVALVGAANFWINRSHFKGNRLHTAIAGKTRRAIEDTIQGWTGDKPTQIRKEALKDEGFSGPNVSVGGTIQSAIQIIPIGIMILGCALAGWPLIQKLH